MIDQDGGRNSATLPVVYALLVARSVIDAEELTERLVAAGRSDNQG